MKDYIYIPDRSVPNDMSVEEAEKIEKDLERLKYFCDEFGVEGEDEYGLPDLVEFMGKLAEEIYFLKNKHGRSN